MLVIWINWHFVSNISPRYIVPFIEHENLLTKTPMRFIHVSKCKNVWHILMRSFYARFALNNTTKTCFQFWNSNKTKRSAHSITKQQIERIFHIILLISSMICHIIMIEFTRERIMFPQKLTQNYNMTSTIVKTANKLVYTP